MGGNALILTELVSWNLPGGAGEKDKDHQAPHSFCGRDYNCQSPEIASPYKNVTAASSCWVGHEEWIVSWQLHKVAKWLLSK